MCKGGPSKVVLIRCGEANSAEADGGRGICGPQQETGWPIRNRTIWTGYTTDPDADHEYRVAGIRHYRAAAARDRTASSRRQCSLSHTTAEASSTVQTLLTAVGRNMVCVTRMRRLQALTVDLFDEFFLP